MSDLAARVAQARASLEASAPTRDPDLEANARAVRAALDPAYAAELEREAAWERAQSRDGYARRSRTGAKQPQCEWCAAFLPGSNTSATCAACGHQPDLAVGHRQHHRSAAQQKRARAARSRRRRT